MLKVFIIILLVLTQYQPMSKVTDAQKQEFIRLLKTLPRKGEFYTDAAVRKAGPYLPVLFALTKKDIEKYDLYPFADISRGLADNKKYREYAVRHFSEIRHPELKLFWGAVLFNLGSKSSDIVRFLLDALKSKAQVELLSEILGPQFEDFKKRIMAHPQAP